MTGVYLIKNIESNKGYIGLSKDIEWRFLFHQRRLRSGKHKNKHLKSSWKNYGEDSFIFMVLEICEEKDLPEREKHWIYELKTYQSKYGYNKTMGGEFGIISEEAQQRKIEKQKKQVIPQYVRDKISKTLSGRKQPKEVIDRRALSNRKLSSIEEEKIKKMLIYGDRITDIATFMNKPLTTIRGVVNREFGGSIKRWKKKTSLFPRRNMQQQHMERGINSSSGYQIFQSCGR